MADALSRLPALRGKIAGARSAMLRELYEQIDDMEDIASLIQSAIVDEPPISLREGGLIRPGYHPAVDEYRSDMTDGKGVIARVEAAEREKTGIKTLKVGYNRVFGYYIEVSNPLQGAGPGGIHTQADPHQLRALHHPGAQGAGKPYLRRARADAFSWNIPAF